MNDDSITFTNDIKGVFMIFSDNPVSYSPLRWQLYDKKAGLCVQEWGDFNVTDYLVWGGPHVIAPEIYGDFPIAPGQKQTWTRLWKFFVTNPV
jgi:hypothetical protein